MKEGYYKFSIITALYIILSMPLIVYPVFAQEKENEPNLFKLSLEELLQIEITVASKKKEPHTEAPAIVSVVSREEFETYGDRNLHQLMQRQPSVYTRHSFVFGDNLAGFRGNMATHGEYHTLILLNGRPMRESALGYNFPIYMGFPLDILENVEIIRGPGSVLYGSNAFTGVINLTTKAIPEQKELSMSATAGSYRYYDATVTGAGRSGDFGHVTSFKTFGTKGHKYRLYDEEGVYNSDNKNEESIAVATQINYKDFKLDIFAADIDAYSLGVLPRWSNPHRRSHVKRLFANLGYRTPINDWIDVEFNVTYNLQEDSLSSPAPNRIGTNTSDVLGEVTIFANPTENLNLVMGYLLEYRSNYEPDRNHFQSIPNYHHKPQSAYFQGDYKIGDAVKLIAGTQWQRSGQGVNDFISRYGLVVTPFKHWGFKFLRGEAFRAPVAMESDLFDPPILTGNSNLKPETITTYDAQVFYHDNKTYAAFTYFTSLIDGLIIYDFGVAPPSYMNGGQHKYEGYEFEAKRYITPNWQIIGSYMHQDNQADEGLNPSVAPEQMIKLGTSYKLEWGTVSLFYMHFGKIPTIPSPLEVNHKPESLNLVNLNVRIDPSHWFDIPKNRAVLTFKIENLFNEKVYAPTFAYTGTPNSFPYGPGTTFYAGLRVNF